MTGKIYSGMGGWTYEPWRGVFYPDDLTQKRELEFASRAVTSIEINGTYYSAFKPDTWKKWHDETPDGFVFSVKASRYCTNRRELAAATESIERFITQGLDQLGDRLGPINWQFMKTKKFDAEDFEAFLKALPKKIKKLPLRHALEVRSDTFIDKKFFALAKRYNAAIVFADDADLMRSKENIKSGYSPADLDNWAKRAKAWAKRGDVFMYFISGETEDAKLRAPAAAQALIKRVG